MPLCRWINIRNPGKKLLSLSAMATQFIFNKYSSSIKAFLVIHTPEINVLRVHICGHCATAAQVELAA